MPATVDRPGRMQVIATWTGGDAHLLQQSLRMSNESFAEYLGVVTRTVANWRKQPEIIPKPSIQEALDTALERAPDRAKGPVHPAVTTRQAGGSCGFHRDTRSACVRSCRFISVSRSGDS